MAAESGLAEIGLNLRVEFQDWCLSFVVAWMFHGPLRVGIAYSMEYVQ